MLVRKLTMLAAAIVLAMVITVSSAERSEARYGRWIGAGIAAAVIIGAARHYRYRRYYGGDYYGDYGYGYYPYRRRVYSYNYYRPYYGYYRPYRIGYARRAWRRWR